MKRQKDAAKEVAKQQKEALVERRRLEKEALAERRRLEKENNKWMTGKFALPNTLVHLDNTVIEMKDMGRKFRSAPYPGGTMIRVFLWILLFCKRIVGYVVRMIQLCICLYCSLGKLLVF